MVYVIIVYDINIERQNKVREFLKMHLNHVQNSVFEGEILESSLFFIKKRLEKIINKEEDSVLIYVLPGRGYIKERIELGKNKEYEFL
ncbi:CRISPR-associated endoribonuclease Cas2 [Nanobdella aerobiophila]|uniref:CRISPR-associated endoribonuclease Cas2 n=1 Tax=Nanobdella aerobiophila TaxID=2586965 RepID=A0A915SCX1_9ARCH|nr:CRISPR-associated endonuclease Cas2 [Nanobdella aerobiophila]BBL45733.1 CRISPR-associated endoribonuclease Cas2 [Nanobdella aerobiophila]